MVQAGSTPVEATSEIAVRPFREGDEVSLNAAYELAFEPRSLADWRWKFQGNPEGFSLITVAESGGEIVGQFANVVTRMQVGERILFASQGTENFVKTGFRQGGSVQLRMVAAQPSLMQSGGIAFCFGFPNEPGYLVGKALLGYQDLFPLPIHHARLTWRVAAQQRCPWLPGWALECVVWMSRLFRRISLRRHRRARISVREVAGFDARVGALWDAARTSYDILTVRSQAYLNWRYCERPQHRYAVLVAEREGALVGYAVVKRESDGRHGQILDILTVPEEAVDRTLVAAALAWCLDHGFDYVLCGLSEHDRVTRSLFRCGFRQRAGFPPLRTTCTVYAPELDPASIQDPSRWHLTVGDSDHV